MAVVRSGEKVKEIITWLVDLFLEDYVKQFNVELDEIPFTEEQFNDLIGKYDSSKSIVNKDVYVDEYTYTVDNMDMKKLTVGYMKRDGKYVVLAIHGFNGSIIGGTYD